VIFPTDSIPIRAWTFERVTRYEAALWRQLRQTLFNLILRCYHKVRRSLQACLVELVSLADDEIARMQARKLDIRQRDAVMVAKIDCRIVAAVCRGEDRLILSRLRFVQKFG
jgi:hypothetical protein